jgi:hypothetical protein
MGEFDPEQSFDDTPLSLEEYLFGYRQETSDIESYKRN